MKILVSFLLVLLPVLCLAEEENLEKKGRPAKEETQTKNSTAAPSGIWILDEKEKEYKFLHKGALAFDSKSREVAVKDKLDKGKMLAVEYQVGTKDGKPAFATIYTADAKSAEQLKDLENALQGISGVDKMLCQGTKVCVKTCNSEGKEYCCKHECNKTELQEPE